jgi:hypothetical protein
MLPVAPGFSSATYLFGSLTEFSTCSFKGALALNCQFATCITPPLPPLVSNLNEASRVAIMSADEPRKLANLFIYTFHRQALPVTLPAVSAIGAGNRMLM